MYAASNVMPASSAKSYSFSCDALLNVSERVDRYVSLKIQTNEGGIVDRGLLGKPDSKSLLTPTNSLSILPTEVSSSPLAGGGGT